MASKSARTTLSPKTVRSRRFIAGLALLLCIGIPVLALAHGVSGKDASFVANSAGAQFFAFVYLGAKHMVTGYDHLLFIVGVIFFLYRLRDVALYVTLFSIGHSLTLLAGVFGELHVNPHLVDAAIGLSVVWKALDNLGGFRQLLGIQVNQKLAVLAFGLVHGFGLATKLLDLRMSADGLVANMLSFNLGVEIGQLCALAAILLVMVRWRAMPRFAQHAVAANTLLLAAGILLMQYQLAGYFWERSGA